MKKKPAYVPERGDIVLVNFTPQAGHEQAGQRPALVLSPVQYNARTGLMLCCPITSQIKDYPFEVAVGDQQNVHGVILADQVKRVDWITRKAQKKGAAAGQVVSDTLAKIHALLQF